MAEKDLSIGNGPTLRPVSASGGGRRLMAGDTILGRYAVVRELGEGGMGVVYQCLDAVGGVEVAVKVLPPEVSRNADEMEDIRANYQIVRKLRHPNIAGIATLEKDAAGGDYYLVMDLAAGVTLKRWARRHPDVGLDAKFAILRQVAVALDYAHAEKVIHRDIKPENVMVDDNGRVKVLDFGLAAQIRSSQSRTSNMVTSKGGTPGYKSPEQWRGKPQREPADVYAFGVMAYWLFSGHLPFDGDDPVVLGHAVLTEPVEPITGIPAHMNAALVKALAKKPDERFASCGAFMDALEGKGDFSHIEHKGHKKSVGSRVPRDRTGGSRSRATAKIFLSVAAVALVAAGGWWFVNARTARSTRATGVSPVATNAYPRATGVSPVATNDTRGAPTPVSHRGSGVSATSPATNEVARPTPQPTWEETQRAVNDAKHHVVSIRKRVESVIEKTIKPYRAHGKYFGEILAEIDRQHEVLKKLKDPTTIAEARGFTKDAETAAEEIENQGVEKLEKQLKSCVSEEITSARLFFGKSERGEGDYWKEVIAAADRALALEPSNAEAKKLKKDAESHLVPTLQVVAKIDGHEISGAKVKTGEKSFTTPFVWKLKEGSRYGPYDVSYENGGKHFHGTLDAVTVDWHGSRSISVALEEDVKPPQRVPDSHVFYSNVIHTVRRGEVLSAISRKYNVQMGAIIAANPGLDPTRLHVGQRIRVPNAKVSVKESNSLTKANGAAEMPKEKVALPPTPDKSEKIIQLPGGTPITIPNPTNVVVVTDTTELQRKWNEKHGIKRSGTVERQVGSRVQKVQLWEGGPYWADRNIGAENPWDYGYYFWWGDTVGYKREGKAWMASDGSSSGFSFSEKNTPTYGKSNAVLKNEGWITTDGNLTSEHDAAHVQWGGGWRMPTKQELDDLCAKCDWTWTDMNGVKGYVVSGRGDYASSSIFLPCAGYCDGISLRSAGSHGNYWLSVPYSNNDSAWCLRILSNYLFLGNYYSSDHRYYGLSVRPVQGVTK